MKKIAIVSFEGEMMCFVHALLNIWDYHEKGYEVASLWRASTAESSILKKPAQRAVAEDVKPIF